ncbi:MAG: phage tail protein [Chryseosolibacter sp.]
MKTKFIFLILFLASQAIFAQTNPGIAVQGIARDADKAALVDEPLTFVFEIQDASGGTSYYKEDVNIKTDPYGVFSHIIGTGNVLAGSGNFNEVPFSQKHMKLIITVKYNGSDIVISNSPFQYSPYAKSAENGVPTGTIVAFAGAEANIPKGWTLCDGRALNTVNGSQNLINLIGSNAPDLRGMFLRGTGTSPVNGQAGPALRATQQDAFESHTHGHNISTASAGSHSHTYWDSSIDESSGSGDYADGDGTGGQDPGRTTSSEGAHTHTINGGVLNTGDTETRPVNYGVNYIIKL